MIKWIIKLENFFVISCWVPYSAFHVYVWYWTSWRTTPYRTEIRRCAVRHRLKPGLIPPSHGATAACGPRPPHYRGFTITFRHTTLGSTTLDKWSARRRNLYLTTHKIHKRHTSMPPSGFEPTIPTSEWPQTHVLDGAATGIGNIF
jgi:hypothetical protein